MTNIADLNLPPAAVDPDARPKVILTNQQAADFGEVTDPDGPHVQIDYVGGVVWRVLIDNAPVLPTPGQPLLTHRVDGDPTSPVVLRYGIGEQVIETDPLAGFKSRRFDIMEG